MLSELYAGCRTYRRFTQEKVPLPVLEKALTLAVQGSSAGNLQPIRYIAVTQQSLVDAIQPLVHWAAYLPREIGTPKPEQQPTAFIAMIVPKNGGGNADIDVGIAAHTLATAAWEEGVGSCLMGAIDRPALNQLLGLSEDESVRLMVALGYPAHESHLVPFSGSVKYWVDENGDYRVPKKSLEETVEFRKDQ